MIYIVEDDAAIRELEQYALNPADTRYRALKPLSLSGRPCAPRSLSWSFWM